MASFKCSGSHGMRSRRTNKGLHKYTHPHEQWSIGQWRVSSLRSHVFHIIDFWHYLSIFVSNVENVPWAKELHAVYNCSGCPLEKVITINEEEFQISGSNALDFSSAHDVLFWRSNIQQRKWTCSTLRVGEPLPKIAAWPPTRKGNLQNGQKLHLSCINTFMLEKGLQGLWCHHLSLWPPALPCSPMCCQIQFLMEELVERNFSTGGQTTSSRSKLFWTFGNYFLYKIRSPQNSGGLFHEKNRVTVLIYNAADCCIQQYKIIL